MSLHALLFYILAALTAFSALAVVLTQNIVRAATWLLFALAGTAGIFFLLGADFIGATQLLIYVGGTLVLVVFGVMLTAQGPFINMRIGPAEWAIAAGAGLSLYGVLAISLWNVHAPEKNMLSSEIYEFSQETHNAKNIEEKQPAPAPAKGSGVQVRSKPNVPKEDGSLTPSKYLGAVLLGDRRSTPDGFVTGLLGLRERSKMSYLLPFEIVSVHLLVVLIGAAYLARAKKRLKPSEFSTEAPRRRQPEAAAEPLPLSSLSASITGAGPHD